ncbi:MAG: DUF1016 N-terminal domain-containing protein [Synergistales bacterium]|nr:DUF1016 N-terminal domain-containing protein [Synergistales bacterium]
MAPAAGVPRINGPELLADIPELVDLARQPVAVAVNAELTLLYWDIGRLNVEGQTGETWRWGIDQQMAGDLQGESPCVGGFSASNLWGMKGFFKTYQGLEKLAPLVRENGWNHKSQSWSVVTSPGSGNSISV